MLLDIFSFLASAFHSHPSLALGLLCGVTIIYYLIIYPFFLSPLRNIPGPYHYRLTRLFALNGQRRQQWIIRVHQLHQKYGNVVVLSPREISVNGDLVYLRDIYTRNFPKDRFYENFRNHGFKDNIFASLENDRHKNYKKILQGLYTKSAIMSDRNSTRDLLNDKVNLIVGQIHNSSVTAQNPDVINAQCLHNEHGVGVASTWYEKTKQKGIEVYSLFGALAMDVVSGFELGPENGTNLLRTPEDRYIIAMFRRVASMGFWTTLMPQLWNFAATDAILAALRAIEKWQLSSYSKAEKNVPKVTTSLKALNNAGLFKESAYSFLTDNIFAGHETTAIQLTYLTYELSRPAHWQNQHQFRQELYNTFGKPHDINDRITDLDRVDKLVYLEALMNENSRVHTSIPGAEPRVTPAPYPITLENGTKVVVPKGTTISVQPYLIHRQESVFPEPDKWVPERWLQQPSETDEEFQHRLKTQHKWMMPFGKGIRMCLGMNLAVLEMKLALANIYWHYESRICEDWCEIDSNDCNVKMTSAPQNRKKDYEMMAMMDTYTTRPFHDECWLSWAPAEKSG